MEALENTIWALVGGLALTGIIEGCRWLYVRRNDRVRLMAKIIQPGDLDVMQRIGCACMIVTLKCVGNRVAKISGAVLALEGVDLIPDLEKGFGASFGYVPVKGGPDPVFAIDLVPLREPNCSDGFILERDDVVRFALPIRTPLLPLFPKAPSQKVWIAVKYFDESEEVVLRGLPIQQVIDDLIDGWSNEVQTLNVTINYSIRAASAVPPGNPKLIGKTNPHPIRFFPDDTSQPIANDQQFRRSLLRVRLPVYTLASPDGSTVALLGTRDGMMMPICTAAEFAEEYRTGGTGTQGFSIKAFGKLQALRSWIENPPTRSGNGPPPFKILFDSLDPNERRIGVIDKDSFLATMPSQEDDSESAG